MLIEARLLDHQLSIRAATDVVGGDELRVEINLDRGDFLGMGRIVVPYPAQITRIVRTVLGVRLLHQEHPIALPPVGLVLALQGFRPLPVRFSLLAVSYTHLTLP